MIQLGYCIPVSESECHDDANVTDTDTNISTGCNSTGDNTRDIPCVEDDRPSPLSATAVPAHIGHRSIDWSMWDGGQIGGQPSWLNPEHLPTGPLTCHCTNTKCRCYISQQQQQQQQVNDHEEESKDDRLVDSEPNATDGILSPPQNRTKQPSVHPSNVLNFIGQFYAPPPLPQSSSSSHVNHKGSENTVFHRTIYIFGCTKCHLSQCYHRIRVLRTQLVQKNRYWPWTTSDLSVPTSKPWVAHLPITYFSNLCIICNFPAKGKCPRSQQSFCGSQHQRLYHSIIVNPKRNKNSNKGNNIQRSLISNNETSSDQMGTGHYHTGFMTGIYTMMEMVVEEEPDVPRIVEIQDDVDGNDNPSKLPSTMFPNTKNDDDEDDEDEDVEQSDLNDAIGKKNHRIDAQRKQQNEANQKIFQQFTNRITERPNCRDQVLRYNCFWPQQNDNNTAMDGTDNVVDAVETDGWSTESSSNEPLWIRADHRPPHPIPKCPYCHSERQFEFQLMPQLLHYLRTNAMNHQEETHSTTTTNNNTTNVVLDALRNTETILEQFHPTNIPPALVEHQQSIIEHRRQQLLLHDDATDAAANSTTSTIKKRDLVKDLLRPPHDWGIVAVYTCPNSCSDITTLNNNKGGIDAVIDTLGAYREEYVWVQPPIDVMT